MSNRRKAKTERFNQLMTNKPRGWQKVGVRLLQAIEPGRRIGGATSKKG